MNVNHKSIIAVDDILVHEGNCVFSDICTFEDDTFCSYANDTSSDFTWKIGDGDSTIPGTGPAIDVLYIICFKKLITDA